MPSINKHSRSLVKNLIDASKNGKSIADIESHVTLCALDIVCGKLFVLWFYNGHFLKLFHNFITPTKQTQNSEFGLE